MGEQRFIIIDALQDFTVLPTAKFRRCVIRSSSVIFLPTSDFPFVGDSPFRRYIGRKNKKTICQWFYRRNLRAKKKKDSRLKYTDGFLGRQYIVIYRRTITVGKSVGECVKYRQNMFVCKFVGNCGSYC